MKPARAGKRSRRRTPPGTAPGTMQVDPDAAPTRVQALVFDQTGLSETASPSLTLPGKGKTLWLNIDGLGDAALLARIAEVFGLHPLAMEDIVSQHQRPKAETYGRQQFLVLRMPRQGTDSFETEQVSLVLGDGFVLSFQDLDGDVFDPVRQRLRDPDRAIRHRGADYLCYALVDAVIDAYFPILESLTDRLEAIEDAALLDAAELSMREIHALKRQAGAIRAAVLPLRDVIAALQRPDHPQVGEATRLYLRDCADHLAQQADALIAVREITSGLVDIHLATQGHRTNEAMRVLTLISTVFIPLTFVAGIYGMNFDIMPELRWRWGYPAVLLAMAAIAVGLLLWFRATGWLNRRR